MSGRRPFTPDPPHTILKRCRFVRLRLRPALYGCLGGEAPCWGDKDGHGWYRREVSWAWKVREFTSDRSFRYIELLALALEYRKLAKVVPPTNLAEDLLLLQGWEQYVGQVRRDEHRWKNRPDVDEILRGMAFDDQKTALLNGLCPVCAGDLPCGDCDTPAVALDGKGGLVAVKAP